MYHYFVKTVQIYFITIEKCTSKCCAEQKKPFYLFRYKSLKKTYLKIK